MTLEYTHWRDLRAPEVRNWERFNFNFGKAKWSMGTLNLTNMEGDSTVPLLFWPKTAGRSLQYVDAHYCREERTSSLSTFLASGGQYTYANGPKLECKTWHSLFDLQVHICSEFHYFCQKTKSASSLPLIFEIEIFRRAVCSDCIIWNFGALFRDHKQNNNPRHQ